jgi:S1-C subfamily serine protease
LVANLKVGEEIEVAYTRDGHGMVTRMVPEPREPARPPTVELPAWGVTARDLTLWSRLDLGQPGAEGVLITSTRPGGPADAAKPPIRPGDLITSVEGAATTRLADLREASKAAEEAGEGVKTPLLVSFQRDSQALLTVVNAGIDSLEDPGREAQKGWLPIETQVLTPDVAERLGMAGTRGVRVTRVYENAAPEGFPLQAGDILTHLDGEAIQAFEPHHTEIFDTMVRQYRIGGEAELTVLRDGEAMKVETALGPSPRKLREMERWRDLRFDFILREATFTERQQADWGGFVPDVVVESVGSGGWASLGGLEAGEAIIAIQGLPVSSLADARAAMEAVHRDKPGVVIVETRIGVQNFFVEMEASWNL